MWKTEKTAAQTPWWLFGTFRASWAPVNVLKIDV